MALPDPKRCLGCGYILEGLPENRCPECGREFSPQDPATYSVRRPPSYGYLVAAIIAGAAMSAWPLLNNLARFGILHVSISIARFGAVLQFGGLAVQLYVAYAAARMLWRGPDDPPHRRTTVAALVISTLYCCAFVITVVIQELTH